jgi:hypothetical protein
MWQSTCIVFVSEIGLAVVQAFAVDWRANAIVICSAIRALEVVAVGYPHTIAYFVLGKGNKTSAVRIRLKRQKVRTS